MAVVLRAFQFFPSLMPETLLFLPWPPGSPESRHFHTGFKLIH
jgi:hypothetical protein